jgi:NADH-quinone oxidoreductase subunit E
MWSFPPICSFSQGIVQEQEGQARCAGLWQGGTMASAANQAVNGIAPAVLETHERLLIDQAIAKHGSRPGALLGILEEVQTANTHKFLSMETLRYIAEETGIPPARVYSAATFYALFNLDPQGDNVICVCRGTACHTRGSRDLLDKLCLDLGLSDREADENSEADKLALTTADRRFTVRTVACFGQCALAPVVEVNHHILSHVNERTLQREVKSLTQAARPREAIVGFGPNAPQMKGEPAQRAVSGEGRI